MTSYYIPADKNVVVHALDLVKYKELCYFFDTNATIKHCVGLLDRFLLHGLALKGAKKHVNDYLTEYFLPFFRQMLRNIVILGWCPYHLKKVKDPMTEENILVPEVVPVSFMQCELEVNMKKIEYNFKFYEMDERVLKPKIKVFIFSDAELIANPSMIHSVLNGTLSDYRFVQQIKRFTIQSEYNRSNPTVYLMREKGSHNQSRTFDQTTGPDGGRNGPREVDFGGNGPVRPLAALGGGARNFDQRDTPESVQLANASMNMADNIEFHQDEMRARALAHQRNYYNIGLDFAPQWHNNLFICPPDMVLAANPHIPESRVDQLTMERNLSSTIYQSFGIPESMMGYIGGSQQSTRGSTTRTAKVRNDVNIMDLNSFESTIERYKMFFKDCFIVLYATMFQKKIGRDVIDFKPPELYSRYIDNVLVEQGLVEGQNNEKQKDDSSKDSVKDTTKTDDPKDSAKDSAKDTTKTEDSKNKKSKPMDEDDDDDDDIKKPEKKDDSSDNKRKHDNSKKKDDESDDEIVDKPKKKKQKKTKK